ncbi:hypothetical protein BpHYR1_034975 [Brachionus plicatilis]|uniref:Uncharacterized protein n=1 Tax=Brachionus plicatilis TaxID=10195 RepID=A0A3M7P1F4_BRAPC|nr:hypothetical protein BpHYR1_034975 [Brachionus plicatilis]
MKISKRFFTYKSKSCFYENLLSFYSILPKEFTIIIVDIRSEIIHNIELNSLMIMTLSDESLKI